MQYPLASGSSPNILESSNPGAPSGAQDNNNKQEEVDGIDMKKVQNHGDNNGRGPGGQGIENRPRALSRSAMVKAVCTDLDKDLDKEHGILMRTEQEKPVKNVCLVDKPQIFPAASSMTTRAVIETSSANSSAEYPTPNHPKGINRMTRKFLFFMYLPFFAIFILVSL